MRYCIALNLCLPSGRMVFRGGGGRPLRLGIYLPFLTVSEIGTNVAFIPPPHFTISRCASAQRSFECADENFSNSEEWTADQKKLNNRVEAYYIHFSASVKN